MRTSRKMKYMLRIPLGAKESQATPYSLEGITFGKANLGMGTYLVEQ